MLIAIGAGGTVSFYNSNFRTTDYGGALAPHDTPAYDPGQTPHVTVASHLSLGIGPNSTIDLFNSVLSSADSFGVPYVTFGDETTSVVSNLTNGWIQKFAAVSTTIVNAIDANPATLLITVPLGPTTRYVGDTFTPTATAQNAFPAGATTTAPVTIQFQDGTLEQCIVTNINQTTGVWTLLRRGANQAPYGGAAGPAPASHLAGAKIDLIYADPGSVYWTGLVAAYNTAHGKSLKFIHVPLGAVYKTAALAGPPYTDLTALLAQGDAHILQSQRFLTPTVPTTADIVAYAQTTQTVYQAIKTVAPSKLCGIQVQLYSPFDSSKTYPKVTTQTIINTIGQVCVPDWMNVFYLGFITVPGGIEDVINPTYRP